jgi:hypothetical protein
MSSGRGSMSACIPAHSLEMQQALSHSYAAHCIVGHMHEIRVANHHLVYGVCARVEEWTDQ